RPLTRTGTTASGWTARSSSRRAKRNSTRCRTTFTEPLADPAQAPANISSNRVNVASVPHVDQSRVAKPVVVVTYTVWNTACRTTFTEPLADPAQAPANISSNRVNVASVPHVDQSRVAKPVVVVTDTVWNTACRTPPNPSTSPSANSSAPRTAVATASRARYRRSSSSRAAARTWRSAASRYSRSRFTPATAISPHSTHCVTGASPRAESASGANPPRDTADVA